jgi:hypothetical protein
MPFEMQPFPLHGLDKGLYLENENVIIPWNISIREITKYSEPKFGDSSNQRIALKKATIFGGLEIDLIAIFRRTLLGSLKLNQYTAYLDSQESIEHLRLHLNEYFGMDYKLNRRNDFEYSYIWKVNNHLVRIGQGDRFGTYYYLSILR